MATTGPKSDEGKEIVAKNALKHGILSREVFVDEGLKGDFEAMKGSFFLQFEPQGQLELFLLERVIYLCLAADRTNTNRNSDI